MVNEIIREIRESPEAREAVRRLILTDELLAMPATQARMEELLARQGERLERVEEIQAQVAALLDRMDARQDRMDTRQDRMEDDLAGIKGSVMEARAERRILALAPGALKIRRSEVVCGATAPHRESQRFIDEFRKAGATDAHLDRLSDTDLIIRAQKGTDGAMKRVYIAVEVAYRLNGDDIDRVCNSVDILRSLALKSDEPSTEVVGALYGARIDDVDRKAAAEQGLTVFIEAMPK